MTNSPSQGATLEALGTAPLEHVSAESPRWRLSPSYEPRARVARRHLRTAILRSGRLVPRVPPRNALPRGSHLAPLSATTVAFLIPRRRGWSLGVTVVPGRTLGPSRQKIAEGT